MRSGVLSDSRNEQGEEALFIGLQTDLGICLAGNGTGKSLVVDPNAEWLHGTEIGPDGESDGDRIEEGWATPFGWAGLAAGPLMVEKGELIGERRAVGEDLAEKRQLEVDLGGVERHDVDGNSGGKERLRPGWIAEDVPLWRGRGVGVVGGWAAWLEVVVAAIDAAAHDDDAPELAEGGWVLGDGRLNIDERADGDKGDLAGVTADLAEQERDGCGVFVCGGLAGIGGLGEVGGFAGDAGEDRNAGAADGGEIAIDEAGAEFCVAKRGLDAEQVELGTAQDEG